MSTTPDEGARQLRALALETAVRMGTSRGVNGFTANAMTADTVLVEASKIYKWLNFDDQEKK